MSNTINNNSQRENYLLDEPYPVCTVFFFEDVTASVKFTITFVCYKFV